MTDEELPTPAVAGIPELPTIEQIEASRTEPSTPAYITPGQEGIRDVPRRLVASVQLPDRRDLEWHARNKVRDADVREAMAQVVLSLFKHYRTRYSVLGFEPFDPEDIEWDLGRLEAGTSLAADNKAPESLGYSVVGSVLIRRG